MAKTVAFRVESQARREPRGPSGRKSWSGSRLTSSSRRKAAMSAALHMRLSASLRHSPKICDGQENYDPIGEAIWIGKTRRDGSCRLSDRRQLAPTSGFAVPSQRRVTLFVRQSSGSKCPRFPVNICLFLGRLQAPTFRRAAGAASGDWISTHLAVGGGNGLT